MVPQSSTPVSGEDKPTASALTTATASKPRIFGLDIFRSCAILLVVLSHCLYFTQYFAKGRLEPAQWHLFNTVTVLSGIYGVELFFVLSGFLIGQILVKQVLFRPGFSQLRVFYLRRWFRTLPAYYFVLLGVLLLEHVFLHAHGWHPWHLVFLQNFSPREVQYFGVAWSLSIEEWFYLLVPPILLLLLPQQKKPMAFIVTVSAIILAIIAIRIAYVSVYHPYYDSGVRKFIPVRFDSLLLGVLMAGIKIYYRPVYEKLAKPLVCLGAFILLSLLTAWNFNVVMTNHLGYKSFDHSFFAKTLGFTLFSLAMVLILPCFESNSWINIKLQANRLIHSTFTYISLWSYSTYLIHCEVLRLTAHWVYSWPQFWISMGVSLVGIFGVSYLMYRFIETPFMRFRDAKTGQGHQH